MSVHFVIDQGLSLSLVFICWWLTHQNAFGGEPFGKIIAAGYAALGLSILANMLFRSFDDHGQILLMRSLLVSKAILTATLGLVALRLSVIYDADED